MDAGFLVLGGLELASAVEAILRPAVPPEASGGSGTMVHGSVEHPLIRRSRCLAADGSEVMERLVVWPCLVGGGGAWRSTCQILRSASIVPLLYISDPR